VVPIAFIKEEIVSLLKCPIDWGNIIPDSGIELRTCLEKYWQETVRKHKVDDEDLYFFDPDYEGDFSLFLEAENDIRKLNNDLANLKDRVPLARREYSEIARRFKDMKIATTKEQMKHYALPFESKDAIIERTRNSDSIYFKKFDASRIVHLMWATFPSVWRHLIRKCHLHYYVLTHITCGASRGKPTQYIRFDIDCSTPQTHAYPVTVEEIPNKRSVIRHSDDLQ
jgi:hypothetical protein